MNDQISAAAAALTGAPSAQPHVAHAHMTALEGSIDTFLALAERVKARGESLRDAPEIQEASENTKSIINSIRALL
ncbi:hypothetical protein [Paraburkholderia caribensis]|uniref:Uncharacterized protein n=1 Tax=Paraburkholderia caribensis TaxID=75105 RepID=A0A9Q6S2R5_9BURK|nr:hypothetical protein [Paraburkholderia caribensis]QLB63470.1 hypothetical protein A9O66_14415 [Paraburkholderia caribensis]